MPRPPHRRTPSKTIGTDPPTGKSAPARTPERARLMSNYNRILAKVCSVMGRNQTSNVELERALRFFGLNPSEVGTLSAYQRRKETRKAPKYGIYNTMEGPPGQHWFCCCEKHKYDPLGNDSSDTQEQPDGTDDCGQRCIAYLLMCKKNGGSIHM